MKRFVFDVLRVTVFDEWPEACILHCSKELKEHLTVFPYISKLNTPKFNSQFKSNEQQLKCSLLLHHLNNASKSLTTRNFIQKKSCPSPWNIFGIFENPEVMAFF